MEMFPIRLPLPFRMGYVNCYLLNIHSSFILIDTGGSNSRKQLMNELTRAGRLPELLSLIILTHGDFDHSGNAAYLRSQFGTQIAMHPGDAGMVENGDMFVNRNKPNLVISKLVPVFTGFGKKERFTPDVLLEDGEDLSRFNFDARVISLPGHSSGSIGILTADGDLFCGDLMENMEAPALNSIMDNLVMAETSIDKLNAYQVQRVLPGHGDPFTMDQLKL